MNNTSGKNDKQHLIITEHLTRIFNDLKGGDEEIKFCVDYSNGRYVLFHNYVIVMEVSLDGIIYKPNCRRITSVPSWDSLPRLFYRLNIKSDQRTTIEDRYAQLIKLGIENSYL